MGHHSNSSPPGKAGHDAGHSPLAELIPEIYSELRKIASLQLASVAKDAELHTTAIVHETYLKLIKAKKLAVQDRRHFVAIASNAIRQIIVDIIRKSHSQKREGQYLTVTLSQAARQLSHSTTEFLHLHEALFALEKLDKTQSKIIELRFFSGLTIEETADNLNISPAKVKREWQSARAFLYRELAKQD